jgi:hypothetical protein
MKDTVVEMQAAKPKKEDESIILVTGVNRGKAVANQHEVNTHKGGIESIKAQRKAPLKTEGAGIILLSGKAVTNQLEVNADKGGIQRGVIRRLQRAQQDE